MLLIEILHTSAASTIFVNDNDDDGDDGGLC